MPQIFNTRINFFCKKIDKMFYINKNFNKFVENSYLKKEPIYSDLYYNIIGVLLINNIYNKCLIKIPK